MGEITHPRALRTFQDLAYYPFVPHPSSQQPRVGELETHHSSHKESLEGITLSIGIIVRVPCAEEKNV